MKKNRLLNNFYTIQKWVCYIGGLLLAIIGLYLSQDTSLVGIPPILGLCIMFFGGLYFSDREERLLVEELSD